MPFDGVALEKLTSWSYGNEKLAELEWLLRQPIVGYEWDYRHTFYVGDCGTHGCAIGLAWATGLVDRRLHERLWDVAGGDQATAQVFQISPQAAETIFFCVWRDHDIAMGDVTPLMVADAIRKYMLTGEV